MADSKGLAMFLLAGNMVIGPLGHFFTPVARRTICRKWMSFSGLQALQMAFWPMGGGEGGYGQEAATWLFAPCTFKTSSEPIGRLSALSSSRPKRMRLG